MTDDVLTIDGLSKSFGGLKVIDDVSFGVRRGSRTALIGPNGAGKTTVFNLLTGVYPVDTGRIVLDGTDITSAKSKNRVVHGLSRSFQNIRLMPHLSTVENVMLGQQARARGVGGQLFPLGLLPGNKWRREAEAALGDAGLGSYPGQVVADLPYGIQKRIEVVRAMVSRPKVLLLDEPAAGVPSTESHILLDAIEGLPKDLAILIIEHDMDVVFRFAEEITVLVSGAVLTTGKPEDIANDPEVRAVYLGEAAHG